MANTNLKFILGILGDIVSKNLSPEDNGTLHAMRLLPWDLISTVKYNSIRSTANIPIRNNVTHLQVKYLSDGFPLADVFPNLEVLICHKLHSKYLDNPYESPAGMYHYGGLRGELHNIIKLINIGRLEQLEIQEFSGCGMVLMNIPMNTSLKTISIPEYFDKDQIVQRNLQVKGVINTYFAPQHNFAQYIGGLVRDTIENEFSNIIESFSE